MAAVGNEQGLIYFVSGDAAADTSVLGRLRSAGWSIQRTSDPAKLGRLLRSHGDRPYAGVVDVRGGIDTAALAALSPALAQSNVGWVAVLGDEQLAEPTVRQLVRDYCLDYVTLPGPDGLLDTVIGHAYGMACLACESGGGDSAVRADGIIGQSAPMRRLAQALGKAAQTDAPVFISGETGTGKELAAQSLHARSRRAGKPFVAVNCGAVPASLIQSELFGYERGAFTGAQARKLGRVQMADGGTLFLDEIGDLPLESQAALLRFLQEGCIERLGGHEQIRVDVRIVSATHHDLERAVDEGRFRADLYHRLCVLRLEQPPLRERGGDIDLLADHALSRYSAEGQRHIRGFAACARRAMHTYPWPGNVRELVNRVRQAVVMSEGRLITAADLGIVGSAPVRTLDEIRAEAVQTALEQALSRNGGRQAEAARELGISRVTLYRLALRHGLRTAVEPTTPAPAAKAANDGAARAARPGLYSPPVRAHVASL